MNEVEFYQNLYKSTEAGYDAVTLLLPKAQDEKLHHDMVLHMEGYRYFGRVAREQLKKAGHPAKRPAAIRHIPARMGMTVNTMFNTKPEHIAELMINGSNSSILDMRKQLNRLRLQSNAEEATDICQKMIDFEQDNVKRMQNYI
ncbi:MAG: hypothetical protein IJ012_07230 [Clostridia bacterium]|nr:hypothetical protein [Clostridia bacterium]